MNKLQTVFQPLLILVLSSFLLTTQAASKSDVAKEKRWEAQIVDSLIVGEDIKLNANGEAFLGLYAEPSTDYSKGAVIILHGIGVHPAWPDVIEPLRMQLPDLGWHTLSLQMPVLNNEAKEEQYSPLFLEVPARVKAGIKYLKNKGIKNIVLSGHSMGSVMASYYMSSQNDPDVKVLAIIGSGEGMPQKLHMNNLKNFKNIKNTFIVDVYGSEDRKVVLGAVKTRTPIGNKIHKGHYQQLKIKGANHFYHGKQNELVNGLNRQLTKIIKQ